MADDYTPTTEEVQQAWAESRTTSAWFTDESTDEMSEGQEEFDRWLTAYAREVAERVWDEGYMADPTGSWDGEQSSDRHPDAPTNPYRIVKDNG